MISSLLDQDDYPHTAHPVKADIFWEAFKDRLGQSEFDSLTMNLSTLLQASSQLGCLEELFTHEEIDLVIQNLPSDKSPGPDGFVDAKINTLESKGKCSPNTEKSTKRASQFDLKLTRKKTESNSRAYRLGFRMSLR